MEAVGCLDALRGGELLGSWRGAVCQVGIFYQDIIKTAKCFDV